MTLRFRFREDENAFIENGRDLMKGLITSCDGKCNPIRSFSAKELKKATNNFDPRQLKAWDSGYKVYKGFLQDRKVSVKQYSVGRRKCALNEIVFASQVSGHKNFQKLIGCCLENEVPILVFEYLENDILNLRNPRNPFYAQRQPLLWKQRLKVAIDIANAISYLHAAFPRPIVFRNIKPSNIWLDENLVAKLSDFSLSISIPEGESHAEVDCVVGTWGYLPIEYATNGRFNEKLDAYTFGAFLLDLLTEKTQGAIFLRENGELFCKDYVKKCIEDNRLDRILDPILLEGGQWPEKEQQQVHSFTAIAVRCLSDSEESRPQMIDVAKELRQIYYA